jgi:hypothetical protein
MEGKKGTAGRRMVKEGMHRKGRQSKERKTKKGEEGRK